MHTYNAKLVRAVFIQTDEKETSTLWYRISSEMKHLYCERHGPMEKKGKNINIYIETKLLDVWQTNSDIKWNVITDAPEGLTYQISSHISIR